LGVDFNLLTEVERINAGQKERFLSKVRAALWNMRGKRLGVLGLAFKGETDDIRDSPAMDLLKQLLAQGCFIKAFDPAAMTRAEELQPVTNHLSYVEDAYSAAVDVDALLILTDWSEFASLDLKLLFSIMRHPMILDGRNMFDPRLMQQHGFTYISVGRPNMYPEQDIETDGTNELIVQRT
jgi:UDPglucose 6-dehydrogenase